MAVNEAAAQVFVGLFIQIFVHGFYTLLFIASAAYVILFKPEKRRFIVALSALMYILATATSLFDVIMMCLGYNNPFFNTNTGAKTTIATILVPYPAQYNNDQLLRIRVSLFVLSSAVTSALVVWRLSSIWVRMKHAAAAAMFVNACIAVCGIFLTHWDGIAGSASATLQFRYDTWRWISFAFLVCVGLVVAGRTRWMSSKMKKLSGQHLDTRRSYTTLGAFVDSGAIFLLVLLAEFSNPLHILRPVLPQVSGIAATLILFQEALGKSAHDLAIAVQADDDFPQRSETPVLDTIFSTTPGVSYVATTTTQGIGGALDAGRARAAGRTMDSLSVSFFSQMSRSRSRISLSASVVGGEGPRAHNMVGSSVRVGTTAGGLHLQLPEPAMNGVRRSRSVGSLGGVVLAPPGSVHSETPTKAPRDFEIFIEDCCDDDLKVDYVD